MRAHLISQEVWEDMIRHAVEEYPYEACGILLCLASDRNKIIASKRSPNTFVKSRKDRYSIDPLVFLKCVEMAEGKGMEICGFYHSHPDNAPSPSAYDLETAWNDYLYLILGVSKGKFTGAKGWMMNPATGRFQKKCITVQGNIKAG